MFSHISGSPKENKKKHVIITICEFWTRVPTKMEKYTLSCCAYMLVSSACEREREKSIFLLGQYGNIWGQLWNGKKLVHFVVTFCVFFSHNYHNHRQTKRNWKKKNSQSNFWGKGLFQRGNKKSVLEGISPKERQTQRDHENPCGCCFFFFLLVQLL